jgi:hypothetical protein
MSIDAYYRATFIFKDRRVLETDDRRDLYFLRYSFELTGQVRIPHIFIDIQKTYEKGTLERSLLRFNDSLADAGLIIGIG